MEAAAFKPSWASEMTHDDRLPRRPYGSRAKRPDPQIRSEDPSYTRDTSSNCHYPLRLQLATRVGLDLSEVRWYLENKRAMRGSLAARLAVDYEQAMKCSIAPIYGARFTLRQGG